MERILVVVVVMLYHFASVDCNKKGVGVHRSLSESYHLRSFLREHKQKRDEEEDGDDDDHHHSKPESSSSGSNPLDQGTIALVGSLASAINEVGELMHNMGQTANNPPTTTGPWVTNVEYTVNCRDEIPTCLDYGPSICTQYAQWAKQQCAQFCVYCIRSTNAPLANSTRIWAVIGH